jgi:NAD(P)H dehydrogenase (quinone)
MHKTRFIEYISFSVLFWMSVAIAQERATILVSYFSQQGHTRTMAEAVARGARSAGAVTVRLLSITETTKEDLLAADAIIVGSPVRNANAASEVVSFMNRWPFEGAPMKDKIGAAFVTAGGISAGEELAQLNILHAMLIYGMIVAGGPDWTSAFGASAITGEPPFDKTGGGVAAEFIGKGERLGKRVAELAMKWKRNR